VFVFALQKQ